MLSVASSKPATIPFEQKLRRAVAALSQAFMVVPLGSGVFP